MGPLFLYSSLMIDLKKINFMGLDQSLNVAMDYKLSHELLMSSPGANLPDHLVIHRSFCSTNQFSPIKRASQLTSHSRILCDFAFSRLSPPDRYHLIVLFSLGLAISTSEPDSVLDRLLDDLGINNFGIQISAIQELLENIDNAVSPRYLNSFNEFSPSFRRLIFMASSFLVNLQR